MPSFVSPSNMKLLLLVVYRMHRSLMSVVSLLHAFVNVFEPVIPSGTLMLVIEQLNSNKEADQRFPVNCKSASALLVKDLSYLRASPTDLQKHIRQNHQKNISDIRSFELLYSLT